MRIRFGVAHDYAPVAGVTLRRIFRKESNTAVVLSLGRGRVRMKLVTRIIVDTMKMKTMRWTKLGRRS